MNSNPCFGPRKSLLFNLFLPSSLKTQSLCSCPSPKSGVSLSPTPPSSRAGSDLILDIFTLYCSLVWCTKWYVPHKAHLFFFSFQGSASSRDVEAGNPMININLFIILYMADGIRNLADVDASLFHLRAWFGEYR